MPLLRVISPDTNPVTASLNVIVTGIGDVLVALLADEVIETVGAKVSTTRALPPASELALPSPGRVRLAFAFEPSLIVPPFSARADGAV